MAIHETPASMVKESLLECLAVSKYCIEYRKVGEEWGEFKTGGCLGFPSAILLFSIIDSIGSYFRNDKSFKMTVNGQQRHISSDGWQHFLILNSKYFNQNLSEEFIKILYSKFRSFLSHNSVLGKNAMLMMNDDSLPESHKRTEFIEGEDEKGNKAFAIVMNWFYNVVELGLHEFLKDADKVISNSKHGKSFK